MLWSRLARRNGRLGIVDLCETERVHRNRRERILGKSVVGGIFVCEMRCNLGRCAVRRGATYVGLIVVVVATEKGATGTGVGKPGALRGGGGLSGRRSGAR